jgi:hypothetical protein
MSVPRVALVVIALALGTWKGGWYGLLAMAILIAILGNLFLGPYHPRVSDEISKQPDSPDDHAYYQAKRGTRREDPTRPR